MIANASIAEYYLKYGKRKTKVVKAVAQPWQLFAYELPGVMCCEIEL